MYPMQVPAGWPRVSMDLVRARLNPLSSFVNTVNNSNIQNV